MVLRGALDRIADTARSAATVASEAVTTAVDTTRTAGIAVAGAGQRVVDTVTDTRDSVLDTIADARDAVIGAAASAVSFTTGAVSLISAAGVGIAMVVAPVPTVIGIILMELLVLGARYTAEGISAEIAEKRTKRENARLLQKLAKYGAIPATALVETPGASLRLDVTRGTITGTVRSGPFGGRAIDTMSLSELTDFEASTDSETKTLIASYMRFREAAEAA